MDMKSEVELKEEGFWWPIADKQVEGEGSYNSSWTDLFHEYSETPDKIAALCKKTNVILQAGGNCGFYVKRFASLFNHVYTFEPDPVNFYCLNLNVTENNVYKFQAALGYDRGCIEMKNEVLPLNTAAKYVGGVGRIPVLRIDDLCLPECDVIQLDLEGFELYALLGAQETIKKHNPIIVVEWFSLWADRFGVSKEDLYKFMYNMNYTFAGSIPGSQGDLVFIPISQITGTFQYDSDS